MGATATVDVGERTVFARKTSGLVKELGAFEAFSINLISLGPGPAFGLFLVVLLFVTGANLMVATLLGALIGIPTVLSYTLMAVEMPRSGGEYVYASRLLHPYAGVLAAFGRMMNVTVYAAVLPYWFLTLSVAPGLGAWGAFNGNSTLVKWGTQLFAGLPGANLPLVVAVGEIVTIVTMILWVVMKPKLAFRIFSGLLILEILGLLVSVGLLLAMGHTGFVNAVNNFMGDPTYYRTVSAYGATFGPYGSSTTNSLVFVPLIFAFYFMFTNAPNYIAGEFKRSKRSITLGMTVSFILAVVFSVLIIYTFEQVVGMNFLNGAVATSVYGILPSSPSITPLPFGAGLTSLPNFAAHGNNVALGIIFLGSASWYLLWIILGLYIFSRYALSMSLDRLFPVALSSVTRRTHSPWAGIVTVSILGLVLFPLLVYYPSTLYTPLVFLLFFLPMVTVSLTSLSLARLGVKTHRPAYTAAGIVSFLVTSLAAYLVTTLPLLGTAAAFTSSNKETGAIAVAVIFVGAGVWYAVARLYNRQSRGIDIALAFKELPPD
jgi:amino acid transporter